MDNIIGNQISRNCTVSNQVSAFFSRFGCTKNDVLNKKKVSTVSINSNDLGTFYVSQKFTGGLYLFSVLHIQYFFSVF